MNPIKLYMYKPMKTSKNLEHLKNYIQQKVHLSKTSDFNDPFEGKFQFNINYSKDSEFIKWAWEDYKAKNPCVSEEDFKGFHQTLINNPLIDKDLFKNHGAICLVKEYSNIAMWAHYGNNHNGYCIVFEINPEEIYKNVSKDFNRNDFEKYIHTIFETDKIDPTDSDYEILPFSQALDDGKEFILSKILYKDNVPSMDALTLVNLIKIKNTYEFKRYFVRNSIATKSKIWNYEREIRIIANANSKDCGLIDLHGYPFIKITGIIMGLKLGQDPEDDVKNYIESLELVGPNLKDGCITDKIKGYIAQMCLRNQIEIYQAKLHDSNYEICYEEYRV